MSIVKLAAKKEKAKEYNVPALAASGFVAKKSVDWSAPRILGLHQGMHGTSNKNYKSIIKNKFMLDPSYGGSEVGSGHAVGSEYFKKNSEGYVHIFGAKRKKIGDKLISKIFQRPWARMHAYLASKKKDLGKSLYVYVPHNLNMFETDPDYSHFAIKTKNALVTGRNRYHSMIKAVKKYGIKTGENIPRSLLGLGILGSGMYVSKKLLDKGLGKKNEHN